IVCRGAEGIRDLRRVLLAIRQWPPKAKPLELDASDSRNDRRVGRVQPRSQAPRIQLRRIDSDLRAHAWGGYGQRPHDRLLPISRRPPARNAGMSAVTSRIVQEWDETKEGVQHGGQS